MSLQQAVQPRPSSNGFGRRKVERETGARQDSKFPSVKPNLGICSSGGVMDGGKVEAYDGPSRDRLVYLATCLIGHQVEVQVKNGSIYSGIFHAMNAENDFGVILKMARLTKDGSSRGQKSDKNSVTKALSKTLMISANELVQVIAKNVSVTGNGLKNGAKAERRQDLMIDSYISQSHFVDMGRELERWTPDEDDLQCPELENIFDGTWNRKWDQFETNEALFGVKSTYDEELYTTRLEKGPRMRELEMKASRIAREIEGEDTLDIHLREERGLHFPEDFDVDEETRFSSVIRVVDDSGYDETEDIVSDSHNTETFGDSSGSSVRRSFSDVARRKINNLAQASSSSSSVVNEGQFSEFGASIDRDFSGSDHARQLDGDLRMKEYQFREQDDGDNASEDLKERKTAIGEPQLSNFGDTKSSLNMKKSGADKGVLSPSATEYAPSGISSKGQECKESIGNSSDSAGSRKTPVTTQPVNARGRPCSSTSSPSECAGAASAFSRPGLSPSSSMGSLSSEKSTLNPYAKEFKLNPNAKSFTPTQTPLRSPSPVSDGSYYFPNNVSAVQHMQSLPVGIGQIGASFAGPQPVLYNPQAAPIQSPQPFIHPNAHLYGQQMIMGHPRQVMYMPSYPPEMPYKGREF